MLDASGMIEQDHGRGGEADEVETWPPAPNRDKSLFEGHAASLSLSRVNIKYDIQFPLQLQLRTRSI